MFLKLKNANPSLRGESILINSEMIFSIYRGDAMRENGIMESVTYIFAPPHGSWEVLDTIENISAQLKRL